MHVLGMMFGFQKFLFLGRCCAIAPHRKAVRPSLRVYTVSGALVPKAEHADAIDALESHKVDVEWIRGACPHVLRYSPARIHGSIAALNKINVDPVKALRRCSRLWCADPQCWDARLAVLRGLDLDVAKVVTSYPHVLLRPPETLKTKIESFEKMGLDATKVLSQRPHVLGLTADRIRGTLAFLESMGLDSVHTANTFPAVMSYNLETKLRPIVHFVTSEMGRDITELQRNPTCFGLSLNSRLRPRYAFAFLHSRNRYSLSALFFSCDFRFARFVGRPLEEYHTWLQSHSEK